MCLGDKKHKAQSTNSTAPTALILDLAASNTLPKPEDSGALLSIAGRVFAETQAHSIYKKFLNIDNDI